MIELNGTNKTLIIIIINSSWVGATVQDTTRYLYKVRHTTWSLKEVHNIEMKKNLPQSREARLKSQRILNDLM